MKLFGASRAETSERRMRNAWSAKGEGRREEDSRVRVMCIGRDARINNSRVISRIIIRYFGLLSARLHPSVANEEAKALEFTRGVRYRANTVTSRMWGETIAARRRRRHRFDVFTLMYRESLMYFADRLR